MSDDTEEGIARSWGAADEEWKQQAVKTLEYVALRVPRLSPDYLWAIGLPKPREPRALGQVMRIGIKNKWIVADVCHECGEQRMVESIYPTQHRNKLAMWRSLLYEGSHDNSGN